MHAAKSLSLQVQSCSYIYADTTNKAGAEADVLVLGMCGVGFYTS